MNHHSAVENLSIESTGRYAALSAAAETPAAGITPAVGITPAPVAGLSRDQEYARMLRTLLGNIDGMVYRCRADQRWSLEFVSAGCERVIGCTLEGVQQQYDGSFETLIHEADRFWVREAIVNALGERRAYDLEYRMMHTDGAPRWVWDRGTGVFDGAGRLLAFEGLVQDITERKRAFQAVHEAERRYRGLFENALEGIFRTSVDGEYIDANPALARIYGYESAEHLMRSVRNISSELYVDPTRRDEFMRVMREHGEVSGFESQIYRKNGEVIWISENARAVEDERGVVSLYEGTVENITDRKRYQARLEYQARHDALTGLANRSLLQDRLEQAIRTASSHGDRVAVVFVDLDQFKLINDTLGHHIGDELLRAMAQRINGCARDYDTVARVGGDEFVLLLNAQEDAGPVGHRLEEILAAVARPWAHAGREFQLTCSLGVAMYPDDGPDPQTLLKHADSALYRAKEAGRNNFQFFTRELTARMTQRLDLEGKLRRALERDQFELHYQPRLELRGAQTVAAEALLRWQLPESGLILPGEFIPVAEETGLIMPLGAWVMRQACLQMRAWQAQGVPLQRVSVNVSPQQFRHGDLVRSVAEVLAETGLPGRCLELELTESVMMQDAPRLVRMLHELKELGVQLSVDDFGSGYSNLGYLKRFPVDYLKIDRGFVQDLGSDPDDAAIVRSIIALGHGLGLQVVAEGVETAAQLEFLRQQGCDEAQGYHLGRPLPEAQMRSLIRQQLARAL